MNKSRIINEQINRGGLLLGGWFSAYIINPGETWERHGGFALNAVPNGALDDVLSVYLNAGTQKTNWYIGLVDNAGFSAFAATDTMSSHAGWSENTDYGEATRPLWNRAAVSGQQITSSSVTDFSINVTVTIKGLLVVSDNTKGGAGGVLFATGAFSSTQSLNPGQTLRVAYTCPASAT